MGNKLGRKRYVVDEKYTRPQGLYQHRDVDHKKLRKLILESKLAPCYPGDEECACDLEECPICFLYYPSLNRSRCCMKSICTECFLQMKTPNSARPTQCPFCKTSNYAVEYRGTKTIEEKGKEEIEEQRVIEAKIRMRQQELQDEEERFQKKQEMGSSSRRISSGDVQYSPPAGPYSGDEIVSSHESCTPITARHPVQSRQNRDDEFDVDLEDIMVMEAIWLSIQENGRPVNQGYGDTTSSMQHCRQYPYVPPAMAPLAESSSSSSPSGGLACAIAVLAERQQTVGEPSSHYSPNVSFSMLPGYSRVSNRVDQDAASYPVTEMSPEIDDMTMRRDDGEWNVDHGSVVAEAGTSYTGSSITDDGCQTDVQGSFQNIPGTILPDSFEEQMMLAMAVSLAEARAMPTTQGVPWH